MGGACGHSNRLLHRNMPRSVRGRYSCKSVDSAALRPSPHQGNLFTIPLGTWPAPTSTPRFAVARRTNCRFTAPYSPAAPGKKGKVWRCGLKDARRELGAEAQEIAPVLAFHVFHVGVLFSSMVWNLGQWHKWHRLGGCPACLSASAGIPQLTLLLITPVPSHVSVDQVAVGGSFISPVLPSHVLLQLPGFCQSRSTRITLRFFFLGGLSTDSDRVG